MVATSPLACLLATLLQMVAPWLAWTPLPEALCPQPLVVPVVQPEVLAVRPIVVRAGGHEAPQCSVRLELAASDPEQRVLCDLLLSDASGRTYGPNHRLRVSPGGAAFVFLPGSCPPGLSVVAGTRPRLLTLPAASASNDPAELVRLCGRPAGVLRR